jgi:hypothetical protein
MVQFTLSPPEYSVLMALLEDGIETNQSHPLLEVFAQLREKIVLQADGGIAA